MDVNNPFTLTGRKASGRNRNGMYPIARQQQQQQQKEQYGFPELQAVMEDIHNGWEFMLDEDFDPVTLALALMDDSSVGKGRDYDTFQRIYYDLDDALHIIVDDYYKGFNNSIGTFGGVLQHINDSRNRVTQMKANLKKCKAELLEKHTDLLNMWSKTQEHKEMLSLLETIEDIRSTPEKLDNMTSNKHVLSAATLLVNSLKTINSKEMMEIGALDDLRSTLNTEKNDLYDMLLEELHNNLYLKSFYCVNLWCDYITGQQTLPELTIKPRNFSEKEKVKEQDMFSVDENEILAEDLDKNPETDPYYYMEIIMEALAVLGEIPAALQTLQDRLPLEIHTLFDSTIKQVESRHSVQPQQTNRDQNKMDEESDIYCLDKANTDARNEILKDLLWTLYSKIEAVLRGHRFIENCAHRSKKRLAGSSNGNFRIYHFHEIWRPIQAEIRSLLQDYLTTQERRAAAAAQSNSFLLKDDSSNNESTKSRTKSKTLFKFTDASESAVVAAEYQPVQDLLYFRYRKMIPELASSEEILSGSMMNSNIVDRFSTNMMARGGHKLLVNPDAYNVSVLLKPTMAFLQRLREVFPNYDDQSEEGFGSFLDDFAVNVFLPQIEEKVMQLIHLATSGLDAFQDARHYKNFSKYPIAKSAVALISVVQSLCRTMHTMPFHTEEYIRMAEVVLLKYYEKCYQRFYYIVARGNTYTTRSNKDQSTADTNISASGDWAQDESLVGLLAQNPYFNDDTKADDEFVKALNQAEITMEFKLKNETEPNRQIEADELIFDQNKLIFLGRLYHSLKWFVREIWELRTAHETSNMPFGSPDGESYEAANSRRWSSSEKRLSSIEHTGAALLPLRGEAARRFDTLLTTYQQLAETCLFTLRLEIRCHTLYYLQMVIRDGNYYLEDESFEPDPYVITLNSDLMDIDDSINVSLPRKDEMFCFDGLPALMVHILISEAGYIKRMNHHGAQKMIRNILALQQNLTNFVAPNQSAVMERARAYYQLYDYGTENLIKSIRDNGPSFTFDEYCVILSLINDANDDSDTQEEDGSKRKASDAPSDWLMKLDEVMVEYDT
ncbi:Sec8 exocyst complex component-specific domain-containing protein [Halteromyces radiatus]|uniref:Sec8 exocyst complex component-specific domain-containing protein n=1 Tax=Halteromyces radiatus TaxID=101107 RepID=UPI00221E448E|nr:Sec8 exocyst complex component-specific domain-containing protein [Halteromyces radiatus]KAI8093036.1 Sec8 exocyst complex component-specific domain-containing protein [Halteromyces radiatus]